MMIFREQTKLGIPLYPINAAVMPVLLYYNTQAALEMPPDELVRPVLVALVSSLFLCSISCLVFFAFMGKGNLRRAVCLGALSTSSLFSIFYSLTYCVILDGLFKVSGSSVSVMATAPSWLPIFWIMAILLVVIAILKPVLLLKLESSFSAVLMVLILTQIGVLALNCFNYNSICQSVEQLQVKEIDLLKAKKSDVKPDVFYIILDQMAGRDGLKEYLQYDDDWFYTELEKRGFYLAKKSLSNYPITRLSLASSLNMSYLDKYQSAAGSDKKNWTMMNKLARDNQTARLFKKQGYHYVLVDSGFAASNNSNIADEIQSGTFTDFFSERILRSTIVSLFPGAEEAIMSFARNRILNQFDYLQKMEKNNKPKFVFTHILSPHEPYLFGANGEPIYFPGGRCDHQWTPETRNAYLAQVEFIQKKSLATIDIMLAKNPDAVFVLQGDHGTHCSDYVSEHSPSDNLLNERYSILNAYKVPSIIQARLVDDIEPVNSFVVILNGLFDYGIEPSPDKQIYSSYDEPFLFKDVSERVIRRREK
ncbi:MAG: hypothetical protein IPG59_13620 [Candidatus Melainabacteria bacterium]|nr:MAG: hypothetical protein IPG59_13620 [Candidatus Melainabacteria bacterium]